MRGADCGTVRRQSRTGTPMKHLYLLRHAKSSWGDPGLSDFDRPLAPRGKRAASRIADHLRQRGCQFDLVLCSAARRAADTWRPIAAALTYEAPVSRERSLYLAGDDNLMNRLRSLDEKVCSVLLIGHNPDLEELADALCAGGEAGALRRIAAKYPTGALATIKLDTPRWPELAVGAGYLESFVVPRDLESRLDRSP